jgi:hypothetical protein
METGAKQANPIDHMDPILLPCPFCGGYAEWCGAIHQDVLECSNCGVTGQTRKKWIQASLDALSGKLTREFKIYFCNVGTSEFWMWKVPELESDYFSDFGFAVYDAYKYFILKERNYYDIPRS